MFHENLDSVREDISKRKLEEKVYEVSDSKKGFIWNSVNVLIAAVLVLGVFFLFLWLVGGI